MGLAAGRRGRRPAVVGLLIHDAGAAAVRIARQISQGSLLTAEGGVRLGAWSVEGAVQEILGTGDAMEERWGYVEEARPGPRGRGGASRGPPFQGPRWLCWLLGEREVTAGKAVGAHNLGTESHSDGTLSQSERRERSRRRAKKDARWLVRAAVGGARAERRSSSRGPRASVGRGACVWRDGDGGRVFGFVFAVAVQGRAD